jgi:hypothetical protein
MHEPYWENPSESFKAIVEMVKDRDQQLVHSTMMALEMQII